MAGSTNVVMLGAAGRNQISVSGVSGLTPSQMLGGRVRPLRQIQQASEKFQGPKLTWKKLTEKDCRE